MFERLIHADWSIAPAKRWFATAAKTKGGWTVHASRPVPPAAVFLKTLLTGSGLRTLAGFDFPIGLPVGYGARTGVDGFKNFLRVAGSERWVSFFDVAEAPAEISMHRPFYPRRARKGVLREHLINGHEVQSFDDLFRECERSTLSWRAACPLFWTLGGNQVGKAAISGWKEVVRPALEESARIWPFDGSLSQLTTDDRLVICETYPAEACTQIGVPFGSGESKRRQFDRASKAQAIEQWAAKEAITLADEALLALTNGFGSSASGEDQFDALIGLLGMIVIAEQRRSDLPRQTEGIRTWEGWILGQAS